MKMDFDNYFTLLGNSVNITVVLGLLAFNVISTFLNKVFFPLTNLYLLEDDFFRRLNLFINKEDKELRLISPIENKDVQIEIGFGYFLKELIMFFIIFTIFYLFRQS